MRASAIVQSVIITALLLYLLYRGYRRRRPHWTRGSWMRFLAVLGSGVAITALVFIEHWISDRWFRAALEASRDATSLWALGVLFSMTAGAGIVTLSVCWFGTGEPTRQFPGARDPG